MSPNIPRNVLKHSGECRQAFQGMLPMFGVNEENYWAESHLESVKHPPWRSSAKIINDLNILPISAKELHRRCSTGFQMRLRLDVL